METTKRTVITVETTVHAPVGKTWHHFSAPEHITGWAFASEDWHAPYAENDLRTDGKFKTRMEAKDGSFGFDLEGIYTCVLPNKLIEYTLPDGRKVKVVFEGNEEETKVTESFDAESQHPVEFQKGGWQAILNNFKKYTETH